MQPRTITVTGTFTILCNRMIFNLQRITRCTKVSNLFPFLSLNHHYSSTPFTQELHESIKPLIDSSAIHFSGLKNSIPDKSLNLFANASSIQQFLVHVFHLNPRLTRKFWRKHVLESQDVLELLLGFESCVGKLGINVKKVESLLGIFKWAKKDGNFKHLDESFKVMVRLLVRAGLFKDAEWVLLDMDKEGILLDDYEICSNLIEWYVSVDNLEKSINMFDRMRGSNFVPSFSCYQILVSYLVDESQSELLFRVYGDMIDTGLAENDTFKNVIRVLCRVGKVQESRDLIKKAYVNGIKPNPSVIDAISSGYCEKKDYDDLLSLFVEINCIPDVLIGNKIIHSMCQNIGVEQAFKFLIELERLGFSSDAITFGILIGWNCKEGNLKDALVCLSNLLSRGLKPHKYSYNAIISAVFKQGMWNHANEIVLEMEDVGVTVDMSTFKILLAGYCKSRQFDQVKVVIKKMASKGLIELLPFQDPVSKAFLLLGIDPLSVRVRRDNDMTLSKTEFYDTIGNGLYLAGDVVDFDQTVTNVLDYSMVRDYNRVILKDDGLTSYKTVDELVHWGQEMSISSFLTLLKKFQKSNSGFKIITSFLENKPNLYNELDEETLNLLVQAYVRRGFLHKAKKIFDKMVKKEVKIENETYSAILKGLCKKGNSKNVNNCWDIIQNKKWSPSLNEYIALIYLLSQNNMVMEKSLSLFDRATLDCPYEIVDFSYSFLEKLCENGSTIVARVLFEKLLEKGYDLDQVAYNHLLRGFCKENRFSEAFVLSNTMLTKGFCLSLNVDFYNVLLHRYCSVKDLVKVKEVFGAILKKNITIYVPSYSKLVSLVCSDGRFLLSIKNIMMKQSSCITPYNILIFRLFSSQNILSVDTLLDEIQEKGLEFDSFTYNFLVYGFAKCKMVSRSVYYFTEMMSKELKPSNRSIRAVIRSLFSDRKFKKVENLIQEMETRSWVHCSTVQNEIVMFFLKIGKLQEAVNFLENIIRKDLVPDNINYENLIKQMSCYGRKDTAFHLLDTMLKKGNIPDSTIYNSLIQDSCFSSNIELALDLYTEMLIMKLNPSIETYEILTEKICDLGRTLEAEKIIDTMICAGEQPSKVMFGSVVSRYRFERNFKKASEIIQKMQHFGYKPNFETHWSVISTLSRFSGRDKDDNSRNFLSRLLSESGFKSKKSK